MRASSESITWKQDLYRLAYVTCQTQKYRLYSFQKHPRCPGLAEILDMAQPRPAPFCVGDDLALDFLISVAAPWDDEIEWLASGGDLVAWLEAAHALPAKIAAQFRAQAGSRALDAVASEARALREWFRAFVGAHAGTPLERSALRELSRLNPLLEEDEAYRRIELAPS